jgi:molybdenum cofactor biosynthesis enzyme MoaA
MDYTLLEEIINEISEHPNTILKIGGLGEPGLYKECAKALELLRKRKVKYIFYTNGTLLHNMQHEDIFESRIPHLVVSIDGIDAESYSNSRIGGDYDRLRADIQAFYRKRNELGFKNPMIEVRHVIFPNETSTQITKFKKFWQEVADTVMYCHYIPSEPLTHGTSSQPRSCRDIMRELYIRWNGVVPLCGYQYLSGKQEWIADINNVSIQKAWLVPKLQELRICHSRDSSNIPGFCKTCVQVL